MKLSFPLTEHWEMGKPHWKKSIIRVKYLIIFFWYVVTRRISIPPPKTPIFDYSDMTIDEFVFDQFYDKPEGAFHEEMIPSTIVPDLFDEVFEDRIEFGCIEIYQEYGSLSDRSPYGETFLPSIIIANDDNGDAYNFNFRLSTLMMIHVRLIEARKSIVKRTEEERHQVLLNLVVDNYLDDVGL